jgi:outer membrane protein
MTWRYAVTTSLLVLTLAGPAIAAQSTRPTPTPAPTPAAGPYAAPAANVPLVVPMPGNIPTPSGQVGIPSAASPVPLTLRDAKMIAVQKSPQLELARAALDLAGATLEQTNSEAFPHLNATGNTGRQKGQTRSGTTVGAVTPSIFTSNNGSLNIQQLIFDGGSTYAKISAAKYSRDAASLSALREVDIVLFGVAQLYYTALQARYTYQVAIESRKLAEVQEALVEAQFRAGVASRADVLTAQLPVAQAKLAEAQAANGEESQVSALLNAMGVSSDTPVTLSYAAASNVPTLPEYSTVQTIALAQRTDLQAAHASLTSSQRSVRAARASRYPVLTGNGSIGTATTGVDSAGNFAPSGGNWTSTYSFGVGIALPLYDSGLINGQIASAEANSRAASANLTSTELGVSLSVRQAYLSAQTALQQVAAAKIELNQAQTVLDVTNAQYRAGVTTLPLLLNAQVGLTKANGDWVNALFAAYTAEQNLYFAEGIISNR